MKLSSLFGWRSKIRRLKIAAGEGAIAAKDRALLLRMAWAEEKKNLAVMVGLAVVLLGLTTVAVSMLSVAIIVSYWDTPHRVLAAWIVAVVWIALWIAAGLLLLATLKKAMQALEPARQEFERDWAWLQERFHLGEADADVPAAPPAPEPSQEELLQRIRRQRVRVATVEDPLTPTEAVALRPPPNEPMSERAMRVAREHPVAAGAAAAAVVAVLGPRRLLRWTSVVLPIVWRLR